jgi:hypothetical protein
MSPDELLKRLAATLKQDIAPAVAADYPRTQAFMTAVVLQKLAEQLRLADAHATAERRERRELLDDLSRLLPHDDSPEALRSALEAMRADRGNPSLCRFIETLYAWRGALGERRFETVLGRVRQTLRSRLDRQMAYAS